MHRSTADLLAAIPHIDAAPADGGAVAMVIARPIPGERRLLDEAVLDPVTGLQGDDWEVRPSRHTPDGSPHPEMQLTLMSARVIDAITGGARDRWALAGDQLYVDIDLSLASLPIGSRLQVGTAEVEITPFPHTGCAKFVARFGGDAMRFVNAGHGRPRRYRGVNARVVLGGVVRPDDVVTRLG